MPRIPDCNCGFCPRCLRRRYNRTWRDKHRERAGLPAIVAKPKVEDTRKVYKTTFAKWAASRREQWALQSLGDQ
jgi:hypothetical protein